MKKSKKPVEEEEISETEWWREYNKEMQEMRETRRENFKMVFSRLAREGHEIVAFTPYQFRIDGVLDIYPSNKRWHDLKHNKRGDLRVRIDKQADLISKLLKQIYED